MSKIKLQPICSYQGGKQRLAEQIVKELLKQPYDKHTIFYDVCSGSGSITLELINQGIQPENVVMIEQSMFGKVFKSISEGNFSLEIFKQELDKLPDISNIQHYVKELSLKPVDNCLDIYHYLIIQSCAFGGKQIYAENNQWKNNSFRSYWLPTETSSRKSPVNPMMPMPDTLFERTKQIVENCKGITVYNCSAQEKVIDSNNCIIYIDPPYINTTSYNQHFDYLKFCEDNIINKNNPVFISEGFTLSHNSLLLSKGRAKGNISGNIKKKPTEEWLNRIR